MSDEELVARANAGDARAFEELYVRHRDWTLRVARRFVRNPAEVADVVQEAFAYLFDRFPGFELTGTLRGFLYPTVKHVAAGRARRERPTVSLDDVPEDLLAGAGAAEPASLGLLRSLRDLSPLHQEILLLRFVDDLTLADIAASLEIPLGTAKSRLHNAIEALRGRLGEKI